MPRIIHFFATRDDLTSLLLDVESRHRIHYAMAGMFTGPFVSTFITVTDALAVRTPVTDNMSTHSGFLLGSVGIPFSSRVVPQLQGPDKYAVDQLSNPDSVDLTASIEVDEHVLTAGRIGATTNSPEAIVLMQLIEKRIRKSWKRIKSYSVGIGAHTLLTTGGRLSPTRNSPRQFDLIV